MIGAYPEINDARFDLVKKIAWNCYNWALGSGSTGLNPPSINDTEDVLFKKICYYTASITP